MKKALTIISAILSVILLLSILAGCKKTDTTTPSESTTTTQTQAGSTISAAEALGGYMYALDKTGSRKQLTNGIAIENTYGTIIVYTLDSVEFFSFDDIKSDLIPQVKIAVSEATGFEMDSQNTDHSEFTNNEYGFTFKKISGTLEGNDSAGVANAIPYIGFYILTDENKARFCLGIYKDDVEGSKDYIDSAMNELMNNFKHAE